MPRDYTRTGDARLVSLGTMRLLVDRQCLQLFDRWQPETATGAPDARLRWDSGEVHVPDDEPAADNGWVREWRGPTHLFVHGAGQVSAEITEEGATFRGDPTDVAGLFLFFPVFGALLAGRGQLLVHAASLARDGVSLLVLGATGSGKSTAALAAAAQGWQVLADDASVLAWNADRAGVTVLGVRRPALLPGDLVGLGPGGPVHAAARPAPGDPRGRWALELPASPLEPLPLVGVLSAGHAPDELGSLEPHSSLGDLVSSSSALGHPGDLRQLFPLLVAVSQLPAWRLLHGADARWRVSGSAALLDDALEQAVRAQD